MWKPYHFEGQEHKKPVSFMENITWKQQKWWRSMRIDSREREVDSPRPFFFPAHFSHAHPSSLRGVRLNFRGCAAIVLYATQLPRRSSSRVGAVWRDERGRRRTGQVGALFLFKDVISILIGLLLHTVLENHHSLRENHDLFNTFYEA